MPDADRQAPVLLTNATKIDALGVAADFWMVVRGGRIAATGVGGPPDVPLVRDLLGTTITPGFIDLHCHGGGGASFDGTEQDILQASRSQRASGVTRTVVSFVTRPVSDLVRSFEQLRRAMQSDPSLLGAHLEGPFLSPQRRGAHNPAMLIEPTPQVIDQLLREGDGVLRVVTLAPELPGALQAIDALIAHGIVVAIGHTAASREVAIAAMDRGSRLLTHAFNAMPGLTHREPGPLGAAVSRPEQTLELILDGVHVHDDVARLTLLGVPGRVALVTDAIAAAGTPDGTHLVGGLAVEVRGGRATLRGEDTLAGSTLALDHAVRRAVSLGVPAPAAIAAATAVPAIALAIDDDHGTLEAGKFADFLELDAGWHVVRTWVSGDLVYGPPV